MHILDSYGILPDDERLCHAIQDQGIARPCLRGTETPEDQSGPAADKAAVKRPHTDDVLALVVLAVGCVHEFAWQLVPDELMGDFRAVTQWPLILAFAVAWYTASRRPFVAAVAIAVGIMSLTTAACSLAWLIHPFETLPGEDQCSKVVGIPLLLVTALGACLALALWRPRRE